MKRFVLFLVALVLLAGVACAESGTWHCETCDADRDTDFCPDCGAARPVQENGESPVAPWPVMELAQTDTALRPLADDEQRHQAYFGPSANCPGAGAYKPAKATGVIALFREGDFVLTDLSYQTVGRRIVYFKASSLVNSDVESVTLTGYPAKTLGSVVPKQGPGALYDDLQRKQRQDLSDFYLLEWDVYDYETGQWVRQQVWFDGASTLIDNPETEVYAVCLNGDAEISVFFETGGWVFAEFDSSLGRVRAWLPAAAVEPVAE